MIPQDRSLLTLILDVTPSCWGYRNIVRDRNDKARAGKRSAGPAKLDEVLSSVLAFVLAFSCLHRENCAVIIGVAGSETAVLYPRKGGENSMANAVHDQAEMGSKVDAKLLRDGVRLGVTELVSRAAGKAEASMKKDHNGDEEKKDDKTGSAAPKSSEEGAAIASAMSTALCVINRFMVSAHGGVSALRPSDAIPTDDSGSGGAGGGGNSAVMAALNSSSNNKKKARRAAEEREALRRARGMLSPRVLVVQCTDDRTSDYNAFMNCVFAASRFDIVIDGCFIPSGIKGVGGAKTSTFLEQAVDRTGGVFLAPSGGAQVSGCLTEVMITAFLPPPSARGFINLPALNKVDFRARCFESGESVDVAFVCNQCLSIFKNEPMEFCPTCGGEVRQTKKKKGASSSEAVEHAAKRAKKGGFNDVSF